MPRDAREAVRQVALTGDAVMLPYGSTIDVVVGPDRRPTLDRLVGKRRETAVEVPVVAVLWRDLKSLDERYATEVLINLYPVGRLSREDAEAYGPLLEELQHSEGLHGACEGRIIADWPAGGVPPKKGSVVQRDFRIKLWLALPAHLEAFLDRGAFRTAVFDPREVPLLETPALPPERFTWLKKRRGCLLPVLAALPSAAIVIVLLLT